MLKNQEYADVSPIADATMETIVLSVVTGYAAYLPADRLGLSGVLAAVTAGLYVGWRAPELAAPPRPFRIQHVQRDVAQQGADR